MSCPDRLRSTVSMSYTKLTAERSMREQVCSITRRTPTCTEALVSFIKRVRIEARHPGISSQILHKHLTHNKLKFI